MDSFILLFAIGLLAGALNAVAGGGSFITFPALVYAGVPPVAANASSTVALFPGGLCQCLEVQGVHPAFSGGADGGDDHAYVTGRRNRCSFIVVYSFRRL